MTEMKARLVDKDGNPLGTAANPLKISGDVGGGVPDGGTTGQVLQKKTDADQDTEWGDGSGGGTWGSITGTLSDQTDLDTALGGKVPTTRTVNSKALSSDISLTASDVGAATTTDITYETLNTNGDVGSTSGTVCAGDDSRLSDARTPDINGLTAETSIADDDLVAIFDTSASANRKMTRANFVAGLGGGSGITWTEVTGTSQAAAADNGYIANNASLVTVTLPSTCAVGKIVRVVGKGAGLWKVAQNAGQIIYFGDQNTTSGTAGYIAAKYRYDTVEMLCITADTTFLVIGNIGNLDVI